MFLSVPSCLSSALRTLVIFRSFMAHWCSIRVFLDLLLSPFHGGYVLSLYLQVHFSSTVSTLLLSHPIHFHLFFPSSVNSACFKNPWWITLTCSCFPPTSWKYKTRLQKLLVSLGTNCMYHPFHPWVGFLDWCVFSLRISVSCFFVRLITFDWIQMLCKFEFLGYNLVLY